MTNTDENQTHAPRVVTGVGTITHVMHLSQEERILCARYLKDKQLTAGFFMHVPAGKVAKMEWDLGENAQNVILVGEGAKLDLQINVKAEALREVANYIFLEKHAECALFENAQGTLQMLTEVHAQERSTMRQTVVTLLHAPVEMIRNYYLEGRGARVELAGVVWGKKAGSAEQKVHVLHAAPETHSIVKMKEVLDDAARSVVRGMIRVEKSALQANSFLSAHALLLHKDAVAQIIPALEIETADVQRVGHATTVSPLDEEQLFYLTTRGIAVEDARKMLVHGFVREALNALSAEEQEKIMGVLEAQWGGVIDVYEVRKDFPIFKRMINGKPLVYLDSAATSQRPRQMIAALQHFYEHTNANIHRGIHTLSEEATQAYEGERKKVAQFIHAASANEIIFTRNTTEAINLVAHAFVKPLLHTGDTILVTEMEHHSNLLPWQVIAKEKRAKIMYVPVTKSGELDYDAVKMLLAQQPKLFACTHVSNVLGTINPMQELIKMAHAQGVPVLVDGAQSAPHMPIDVQALDADFFVFSAHKMLGPMGVGVLYGKRKLLEQMPPFLVGGGMIKEVEYDAFSVNDLPWKFEAGTQNVAGVVAFGAAIDYLNQVGMDAIQAHEQDVMTYAYQQLVQLPWVEIYGPCDLAKRAGVIAFNCVDASKKIIHPHDVVAILDEEGIAVRSGHHCAMPLHTKLGLPSSVRISFAVYTAKEDIDRLIVALKRVVSLFNKNLEVVA